MQHVRANFHIGLDIGSNIEFCQKTHTWGKWHCVDFSTPECLFYSSLAFHDTVVLCSDVIEHIQYPTFLLEFLKRCYEQGAIVITSTPDRVRARGIDHCGPPSNPFHIREWELNEYKNLLESVGIPCTFIGYTLNNNEDRALNTILSIHDPLIERAKIEAPVLPPPVAIIPAYNEEDVIQEAIEDMLRQECHVIVINNHSTDNTQTVIEKMVTLYPGKVTALIFPENSSEVNSWYEILSFIEDISVKIQDRWIIRSDADEIRRAPFPDMTLKRAFEIASFCGYNRVGFNLINFRPVDNNDFPYNSMQTFFKHFQFGEHPGHFIQYKAWFQESDNPIALAESGGHSAEFKGKNDFPYRFLLKHYPLRSVSHAKKKLQERSERWAKEKLSRGWHAHYDHYTPESSFTWDKQTLYKFDENFWLDYGLTIITDLLERRRAQSIPL